MSRRIPPLREMLAGLVAIPSVSSPDPALDQPNEAVVARLAEWLEALGFAVEVLPVPGRPGKANLVATLGRGPGGLVLAGHTDTVPFDAGRWSSDPFRLTEREGRLHGLGTADMKGFFPLVLEVAAELEARRLRAPLVVLATADEESTMSGARALAESGRPLGRHAVIGEPTRPWGAAPAGWCSPATPTPCPSTPGAGRATPSASPSAKGASTGSAPRT